MTGIAQTLGNIRKVESGSTKSLREFEKAVRSVKRVMVKASQVEGRKVFKRNARRYARGQYANRRGALVRIKDHGPKWKRRKQQLKLDKRRGVARKGVLKTVQSPKAFIKNKDGFTIDYERPNITVTGRATLGKSQRNLAGKRILGEVDGRRQVVGTAIKSLVTNRRSFRVNAYIGHFADQKAPGLGSITTADVKGINKASAQAVDKHVQSIRGASRVLSKRAAAKIEIKLGKLVS